jgi:Concanavalin A-like lectin/glucanases superfamily
MISTPCGMAVVNQSLPPAAGGGASLLLHFDGSNGATTTTDSSALAHTVSMLNGAQLSTTDPKFGSACLLLDGSNDRVTIPYHADMHLNGIDFNVNFWLKTTASSGSLIGIGDYGLFGGATAWAVQLVSGKIRFVCYTGSIGSMSLALILESTTTVNNDVYRHVAVTKAGDTHRVFVDGTLEASGDYSGSIFASLASAPDPRLCIGSSLSLSGHYAGRIDEVQIVPGDATWTTSFTPPSSAY